MSDYQITIIHLSDIFQGSSNTGELFGDAVRLKVSSDELKVQPRTRCILQFAQNHLACRKDGVYKPFFVGAVRYSFTDERGVLF